MISIGDYSLNEKEIRRTKIGQIYECINDKNKKQYYVEKIQKEKIREEYKKILDMMKNPSKNNKNILKIYDVIQKDAFIYIITEKYDYTLQEYVDIRIQNYEQLKVEEIKEFMYQIVDGYLYLINQQIIHGDLNFKTIVVQQLNKQNLFKLTQFNYSQLKSSKLSKNQNIPLIFQAPELLENQKAFQTEKSDIYSFGLILLQIFKQTYLKSIDTIYQLNQFLKILKETKQSDDNIQDSDELQIIIEKTIVYQPENRCNWIDLKRSNSQYNDLSDLDSTNEKVENKHFQLLDQKYQIKDDDYEIDGQIISRGSQGCILNARKRSTNELFVAKQLFGNEIEIQRELDLFQILKDQKHENIVQFVDQVKKNSMAYLIIEKCDKSLYDYKKQINTDEKIKDFLQQIISGYLFLKEKKIIHRDLKPQNIMIKFMGKKPIYKIIDFGVGKKLLADFTNTKIGTPVYMAPEVYFQKQHNHQCDLFSVRVINNQLGLILYEIVYQQRLIQTHINQQDIDNFFHKIKNERFRCPFYHNPNLQDLIEKMIIYDQDERIQWDDVLTHSFFKPLEIQELLFQIFQLAKNILIYIENNFRQLNEQMIIQLKMIILQFCLQILSDIFKICDQGEVVIDYKVFKLQQNLQDSQEWLCQIKFSEQIQFINGICNLLNKNYYKQLYQKKSIIQHQNEFKDQYLQQQDILKSLFNNFEIQNSIGRFLNIFEDTPLPQPIGLVESIIPINEQ